VVNRCTPVTCMDHCVLCAISVTIKGSRVGVAFDAHALRVRLCCVCSASNWHRRQASMLHAGCGYSQGLVPPGSSAWLGFGFSLTRLNPVGCRKGAAAYAARYVSVDCGLRRGKHWLKAAEPQQNKPNVLHLALMLL
jgi:hypothetical protein